MCGINIGVSVRFRGKELGTRVKDRAKSFFGSRFISRAVKTESPLPRSFFAPKPNGNACYAGYVWQALPNPCTASSHAFSVNVSGKVVA